MARDMTHNGQRSGGRRRKPYAWQRGLVPSSVPADQQKKPCLGCKTVVAAKTMKMGYCRSCWTG